MSPPAEFVFGRLPESHLAAEQLHAITIHAKSHRKSCSDFVLLTVAFGQSKKQTPQILPLSFNMDSLIFACRGADNTAMMNLLGLGEGYCFKVKYLGEDTLES